MYGGVDPAIGVITPFEGVGPLPTGLKDLEDTGVILAALIWGISWGLRHQL